MRTFKVVTIILLLFFTKNVFSQYETINLPIEINRFGGNVTSFITNQHNPFIYSTTNGASTFPFTDLGHLVIQPRTSTLRDILFVTGDGDDIRMAIKGNGNIGIGTYDPSASGTGKILHLLANGDEFPFIRIERNNGITKTNRAWETFISSDGSYYIRDVSLTGVTDPFIIQAGAPTNSFKISSNGNIEFYSGTTENTFRFGRNINENFKFYVTDNSGFLDYNQDEDNNSTHIFYIRNLAGGSSPNNDIRFQTTGETRMAIRANGNIGIGTLETGTHKLAVEGTIGAREIIVEADGWSDFVFNKDYKLKALEEVENYIEENNHLPDVPSEKEVLENGVALGEMDAKLLQKIEELTLYMIEQNKKTETLIEKVETLEFRVSR